MIVNNILEISSTLAADTTVKDVDANFEELIGIPKSKYVRTSYTKLIHNKDYIKFMQAWSNAMTRDECQPITYRLLTSSKLYIAVESIICAIRSPLTAEVQQVTLNTRRTELKIDQPRIRQTLAGWLAATG